MWLEIVTAAGALGSFGAFAFLGWQTFLARRAAAFDVYQKVSERFSTVLWYAADDPTLHYVWKPFDATRSGELRRAPAPEGSWGEMTDVERKGFRYTRMALEVLEQAHEAWTKRLIDDEVWEKWKGWIRVWMRTRYFDYVIDVEKDVDPESPFQPGFVRYLRRLKDECAEPDESAPRGVLPRLRPATYEPPGLPR